MKVQERQPHVADPPQIPEFKPPARPKPWEMYDNMGFVSVSYVDQRKGKYNKEPKFQEGETKDPEATIHMRELAIVWLDKYGGSSYNFAYFYSKDELADSNDAGAMARAIWSKVKKENLPNYGLGDAKKCETGAFYDQFMQFIADKGNCALCYDTRTTPQAVVDIMEQHATVMEISQLGFVEEKWNMNNDELVKIQCCWGHPTNREKVFGGGCAKIRSVRQARWARRYLWTPPIAAAQGTASKTLRIQPPARRDQEKSSSSTSSVQQQIQQGIIDLSSPEYSDPDDITKMRTKGFSTDGQPTLPNPTATPRPSSAQTADSESDNDENEGSVLKALHTQPKVTPPKAAVKPAQNATPQGQESEVFGRRQAEAFFETKFGNIPNFEKLSTKQLGLNIDQMIARYRYQAQIGCEGWYTAYDDEGNLRDFMGMTSKIMISNMTEGDKVILRMAFAKMDIAIRAYIYEYTLKNDCDDHAVSQYLHELEELTQLIVAKLNPLTTTIAEHNTIPTVAVKPTRAVKKVRSVNMKGIVQIPIPEGLPNKQLLKIRVQAPTKMTMYFKSTSICQACPEGQPSMEVQWD